jgi:hypothetical protein
VLTHEAVQLHQLHTVLTGNVPHELLLKCPHDGHALSAFARQWRVVEHHSHEADCGVPEHRPDVGKSEQPRQVPLRSQVRVTLHQSQEPPGISHWLISVSALHVGHAVSQVLVHWLMVPHHLQEVEAAHCAGVSDVHGGHVTLRSQHSLTYPHQRQARVDWSHWSAVVLEQAGHEVSEKLKQLPVGTVSHHLHTPDLTPPWQSVCLALLLFRAVVPNVEHGGQTSSAVRHSPVVGHHWHPAVPPHVSGVVALAQAEHFRPVVRHTEAAGHHVQTGVRRTSVVGHVGCE